MLERLTRRTVLDFEPYEWEPSSAVIAARHGLQPRDVIRFDLNTSPFPPASWDAAVEAARLERLPNEYFDPAYLELADLISAYCDVSPANLVIGTGADEILDIIVKTLLDNGDAAVIAPPTYSFHAIVTAQIGGTIRNVPLLAPDFALDVPGVLKAAEGAKLIWICNPNSPTGNPFPPDALRDLLDRAPCFVAIDEAYAEFAGWSAVPLVAQYPHLIVVRTMSKAFGLAGMRLGWAVAQEPVAAMLNRVRPPNSVNIVTARVAAAALRDIPAMRDRVAAIVAEREPLADALRALGAQVYPSVTNFLLTRWGDPATAQAVYDWLESQGMMVRNFSHHRLIPGHLRITVRAAAENARLLAALATRRTPTPTQKAPTTRQVPPPSPSGTVSGWRGRAGEGEVTPTPPATFSVALDRRRHRGSNRMTAPSLRPLIIAAVALLLLCCAGLGLGGALFYRASTGAGGGRYPLQVATPAAVTGLDDPTAIAAGADHSLALGTDGAVWAWGANQYGQLGTSTGKDCGGNSLNAVACSHRPLRVPGLGPVRAVAAGANHSLALGREPSGQGRVWAWGWNQSGQLGDGTVADRLAPAVVPGLADVIAIAAGGGHSLALRADGSVWQWGGNLAGGQTCQPPGWPTGFPCSPLPVRVGGLPAIAAIAAGGGHSLALDRDGGVWAWGRNGSGQLGLGTVADRPTPARLAGLTGVIAIAAGRHHSLALRADGNALGWGDNAYGQLGTGSRDSCPHPVGSAATVPCALAPVTLRAQGDLAAVAAGDGRTLLQTRGGTALRLGYTEPDPAGFGSAADACELAPPTPELANCKAQPTLIPTLADVAAIAVGGQHFLALARDRSGKTGTHAWGNNYHGQTAR